MQSLLTFAPLSILLSLVSLLCFLGAFVTHLGRHWVATGSFYSRFLQIQRSLWLATGIVFALLGLLQYVVGN